jgi:hypothetical protein
MHDNNTDAAEMIEMVLRATKSRNTDIRYKAIDMVPKLAAAFPAFFGWRAPKVGCSTQALLSC